MSLICRVFGVDMFGDVNIFASDEIRTALRHWVITVAVQHMHEEKCCLIEEIHYALDYYLPSDYFRYCNDDYFRHVINSLIQYYHNFFDFALRFNIVESYYTTPFHDGVFLITRD